MTTNRSTVYILHGLVSLENRTHDRVQGAWHPGKPALFVFSSMTIPTPTSGWWFGTFFMFPYILGIIIPFDSYFSEG